MNKFDYKRLTPFKWFILENFPFIEEDFDALTNWQLFCKIGKEINKIIQSQNQVGTQMENVTNAFIELQDYVNDYFENLDIQEEVNNKLDEMAESGQLADIITEYLQLRCIYGFDTIQSMSESTNLVDGSFMRTYGQEDVFDGLGAFYKARQIRNTDVIDGINIVALSDENLVAQKIIDTNFENFVSEVENNFDDVENKFELINSKDSIMIGDSYGQGYTYTDGSAHYVDGWCNNLKSIMNLSNNECYIYTEGGIGFADPRTRWPL